MTTAAARRDAAGPGAQAGPAGPAGLAGELDLDRARAAARSGDLAGALGLLRGASPDELDLRARIHAQRGEFDEADAAWAKVLAADPSHTGAAEGRRAIAGRTRRRVLAAGGAALAVVLLAGGGAWWLRQPETPPVARPAPIVSTPASLPPPASPTPPASSPPAADNRLLGRLAVDGVTVRQRGAGAEVVFDEGLFVRGGELRDGARGRLDRVGRALRDADVTVTVVGHAVPVTGGRTTGGSTVALARAQVAAARLARASRLPITAFSLVSADQQAGPHDSAARNRTVTLLVEPA